MCKQSLCYKDKKICGSYHVLLWMFKRCGYNSWHIFNCFLLQKGKYWREPLIVLYAVHQNVLVKRIKCNIPLYFLTGCMWVIYKNKERKKNEGCLLVLLWSGGIFSSFCLLKRYISERSIDCLVCSGSKRFLKKIKGNIPIMFL